MQVVPAFLRKPIAECNKQSGHEGLHLDDQFVRNPLTFAHHAPLYSGCHETSSHQKTNWYILKRKTERHELCTEYFQPPRKRRKGYRKRETAASAQLYDCDGQDCEAPGLIYPSAVVEAFLTQSLEKGLGGTFIATAGATCLLTWAIWGVLCEVKNKVYGNPELAGRLLDVVHVKQCHIDTHGGVASGILAALDRPTDHQEEVPELKHIVQQKEEHQQCMLQIKNRVLGPRSCCEEYPKMTILLISHLDRVGETVQEELEQLFMVAQHPASTLIVMGGGDGFAQLACKLARKECPVHHLSYDPILSGSQNVYVEPFISLEPRYVAREVALQSILHDEPSLPPPQEPTQAPEQEPVKLVTPADQRGGAANVKSFYGKAPAPVFGTLTVGPCGERQWQRNLLWQDACDSQQCQLVRADPKAAIKSQFLRQAHQGPQAAGAVQGGSQQPSEEPAAAASQALQTGPATKPALHAEEVDFNAIREMCSNEQEDAAPQEEQAVFGALAEPGVQQLRFGVIEQVTKYLELYISEQAGETIFVTGPAESGKTSTVMAATGARSGTVSLSATERQAWLCVGTGREPASSWPTHVLDAIEGRSRHEGNKFDYYGDLAKLKALVTKPEEAKSASGMYVVVIDRLQFPNSPQSHEKMQSLFQLTKVPHSRLILICIAEESCISRLGLEDVGLVPIPAVITAEMLAMLQHRLKDHPTAFAPAALKMVAQQEKIHKGRVSGAVLVCRAALRIATGDSMLGGQALSNQVKQSNVPYLVSKQHMQAAILANLPETTTAERDAQWEAKKKERQVKLQEAESRIPKLKPLMEILRESLQSTESPEKMTKKRMKDLQDRDERRRELMVLKETPLCETQWSNFQHDHMPSQSRKTIMGLQSLPLLSLAVLCVAAGLMGALIIPPEVETVWVPVLNHTTNRNEKKQMPIGRNGQIVKPDPEAPEEDAFGYTCSLRCVEEYCCTVLEQDALKMVLWRDEFVRAWQLLIDRKVMKGTACKDGRPTRLQLAVQEWHLRAAFESNVWAHRFTRTFRYIKSHPGRFAKVALGAKNALPPAYIWSKKR